jgi:hypothetical protein
MSVHKPYKALAVVAFCRARMLRGAASDSEYRAALLPFARERTQITGQKHQYPASLHINLPFNLASLRRTNPSCILLNILMVN